MKSRKLFPLLFSLAFLTLSAEWYNPLTWECFGSEGENTPPSAGLDIVEHPEPLSLITPNPKARENHSDLENKTPLTKEPIDDQNQKANTPSKETPRNKNHPFERNLSSHSAPAEKTLKTKPQSKKADLTDIPQEKSEDRITLEQETHLGTPIAQGKESSVKNPLALTPKANLTPSKRKQPKVPPPTRRAKPPTLNYSEKKYSSSTIEETLAKIRKAFPPVKKAPFPPPISSLQANCASSMHTLSNFLFRRSHHPGVEREPLWITAFFSSSEKFEPRTKPPKRAKIFTAERSACVFGWEEKQPEGSFGIFAAYQYTNLSVNYWSAGINDLYLGIFGSFFEERPLYLTYSLIAGASISNFTRKTGLKRYDCCAKTLMANNSLCLNFDFSAVGLPFLHTFVKGDLFYIHSLSKEKRENSFCFSREIGLLIFPTFFEQGAFFEPHFSLSYSQQPKLSKHIFSPEFGLKVGRLRDNFFLTILCRGEKARNYHGGFFLICLNM